MATRSQHSARRLSTTRPRRAATTPSASPSRPRSAPRPSAPPRLGIPLSPLSLGQYPFIGPFARWEQLEHSAGIVALVEQAPGGALSSRPLWLAEADDLQEAMAKFQAKGAPLSLQGTGPIAYAALYTNLVTAARRQIVAELRTRYQLPSVLPTAAPHSSSSAPVPQSARRRSPARRRGT